MKRQYLIEQLAKLYDSIPDNASSYHICDMLIYKAEKMGMLPPSNVPFSINPVTEEDEQGNQTRLFDWVGWEKENIVCPECEGSGFIGKLYPSGHTEVKCERCNGEGMVEDEE